MAYSTSNPPNKLVAGTLDGTAGPSIWTYKSTDAIATVDGANYFTNGQALGMVVGDIVFVLDTTNTRTSIGMVASVTSSGATLGTTATTTNVAGVVTLS